MPDIEKKMEIAVPIERVWAALTDPATMRGWMGNDDRLEVDLRMGGRFRLFGGETSGAFTRIQKPNSLEYTWRQKDWHADWPDSLVRWELKPTGRGTQVHVTHSRFPDAKEQASHVEGWDTYWLNPMKTWLESQPGIL
jgi:uncharacterized protein YndB with AHSA1/START domain